MNMYEFLSKYQDHITTGTAQAIARDLGVDLDFDLVGEAP